MADVWTAQLHIAEGQASEDAPEIAYAERVDERGQPARLFILAEPGRPGSEQFIEELVTALGEEFVDGAGSLTGLLQRAIRQRHEDLLDWNRNSLPRDQASYGLSCLIQREPECYLAQMGPSLVFYRQGGRLLRRRPASERSTHALGSSEAAAPEFSQLELAPGDWALLISSNSADALADQVLVALRGLAAEDVLPALYPHVRRLERVSALVVAPQAAVARTTTEPGAPAEPAETEQPVEAEEPGMDEDDQRAPSAPTPVVPEPAAHELGAEVEEERWAEDDEFPDAADDDIPERTPVGEALRDGLARAFAPLRRLFARTSPRDPWAEAEDDAPRAPAPPPAATEVLPPAEDRAAEPAEEMEEESPAVRRPDEDEMRDDAEAERGSEGGDDEGGNDEDADDEDDESPRSAPGGTEANSQADGEETGQAEGEETGQRGTVEFRLLPEDRAQLARLDAQYAAGPWPRNPFTGAPAPILDTAEDVDASQIVRPLFGLSARMPSFRRRPPPRPDRGLLEGPSWRPVALGLAGLIVALVAVAGVLLIPDLVTDSERSEFERLVETARDALTAATLNPDPESTKLQLELAGGAVARALDLRPLDADAQILDQEIAAALRQVNSIVQPEELRSLFDAGPGAALSLVEVAAERLFVLDEAAGRVLAIDPAGGGATSVFEAGTAYLYVGEFADTVAGDPISIEWTATPTRASLTVLDDEGQIFRWTEAGGIEAYRLENGEVLGSADAVTATAAGVYVLDAAGGAIWLFPFQGDGRLAAGAAVITRTDLTGATDLTVVNGADGSMIFVSSGDGRVRRFVDGQDRGFPLALDRPLLVPASLGVGERSGLLYVVDRGNNRILALTPDGSVVAQIRDERLSGVRGLSVDELNDTLFYVTPTTLLRSALPDLLRR